MVKIAEELDIQLYSGEISQVIRIGIFRRAVRKPRSIRMTFVGEIKHDIFLQRKKMFKMSRSLADYMVYPDETPAFKAHLRFAVDLARRQGCRVWQRFNVIMVDGRRYEIGNYAQLLRDSPQTQEPTRSRDVENSDQRPKTLEELRKAKDADDMASLTHLPQTNLTKRN